MLNQNLLIDTNVGDEGLKYLSESLKVNTTLTQLDLAGSKRINELLLCFTNIVLNHYSTQLRLSGKPENGGIIVAYKLDCTESTHRQ